MNHDTETRLLSVMDLAEAALGELERVDTVKLAALGRDKDAAAVGNTRRLLDRLQLEGKGLQSQLVQVTQERETVLVKTLDNFRSRNIRRVDLITALWKAGLITTEQP